MTGYESKRAAAQDKLDSMERKALKLALRVLEDLPGFRADIDNAITAIKEALAHLSKEPVANDRALKLVTHLSEQWKAYALELQERLVKYEGGAPMLLNTAPPQPAQGKLDNEDDLTIAYQSGYYDGKKAAQPAQEPVAWMNKHGDCKSAVFREAEAGAKEEYNIPLYTNQTLEKNNG